MFLMLDKCCNFCFEIYNSWIWSYRIKITITKLVLNSLKCRAILPEKLPTEENFACVWNRKSLLQWKILCRKKLQKLIYLFANVYIWLLIPKKAIQLSFFTKSADWAESTFEFRLWTVWRIIKAYKSFHGSFNTLDINYLNIWMLSLKHLSRFTVSQSTEV